MEINRKLDYQQVITYSYPPVKQHSYGKIHVFNNGKSTNYVGHVQWQTVDIPKGYSML